MPNFTVEKLKKMYEAGKKCDEKLFSEQRTNILMRMGDHYKNKSKAVFEELRSRGVINKEQKIRLTKNHIHRITNFYMNSTLDGNPSVTAVPFNEDEIQDVKAAELSNSILAWAKYTTNWEDVRDQYVHDHVVIGECAAKVSFNYDKGPVVTDVNGESFNTGEFEINRIFAFDLKRDPAARSKEDSRWFIHEQLLDMKDFKELVKELSPENVEKIKPASNDAVKLFDASTGSYREQKNLVDIKELYYKPDKSYKNGYYVMFSDDFIIVESELPFGIFPIAFETFDDLATSPRGSSIIKVLRPYQVEINRASSKMAEHQITLGDDKVYIQKGTKIANGGTVHGVRAIQISGQTPTLQPGRTGDQYANYQLGQIKEMYDAANVADLYEEKAPTGDPYQLLFRTMKEKKKFAMYVSKFERFEVNVFKILLKMSKNYLTQYHVIKAAGRSEIINVEEFINSTDDGFQIKVVPQTGDIETKFGKMLSITQTLQYAGKQLSQEQIGSLIKHLPLGNEKQALGGLTVDTDNAMNDILALDRGMYVPANPQDNHMFMINSITHRMKKPDFRFLNPEIQQMYEAKRQEHGAYLAKEKEDAMRAQIGTIPTGGFLITVNASWFNPASNRVERIKVPSASMQWLVSALEKQGLFNQQLSGVEPSAQGAIADQEVTQAPLVPGLEGPQPQDEITTGPQAL